MLKRYSTMCMCSCFSIIRTHRCSMFQPLFLHFSCCSIHPVFVLHQSTRFSLTIIFSYYYIFIQCTNPDHIFFYELKMILTMTWVSIGFRMRLSTAQAYCLSYDIILNVTQTKEILFWYDIPTKSLSITVGSIHRHNFEHLSFLSHL